MTDTLYENLEVSSNASPETIRAAYRSLSQRYHPDKNPGDSEAAQRMQQINAAFQVLSSPDTRAAYDAELSHRQRDGRPVSPPSTGSMFDDGAPLPASGRLGGLFCLGLSAIGLLFVVIGIVLEQEKIDKIIFVLGSAIWVAIFGYLSYSFYSGRANRQLGTFRIALTLAGISMAEGVIFGIVEDGVGWKVSLGIAGAVFFSVAAWREYRNYKRSLAAR
jgi:curved DNA-binding protein CbpA